ncbi:MAG: YfiR family protein [Armatimonadota bacterium]|nr:YfiR family protein [bacterium]
MNNRTRSFMGMAVAILLLTALPQIGAVGRTANEYEVKAAFLYNFAQFVEWPSDVFRDSKSPMVIGVFGQDPFGSTLDEAVKNKTVNGRRFVIKRFKALRDIETCQILFVSASEGERVEKAARAAGGKGVLTVGESSHFIDHGGIINFTIDNSKIGLEISVDHARNASLKISSKLLRLAKVV